MRIHGSESSLWRCVSIVLLNRVVRSFETILSVSAQQLPLNEVKSINVPSLAIRTERVSLPSLPTIETCVCIGSLIFVEDCRKPQA